MTGFQSPNYTQTPNDLFDELLPEMGLAELKVVLCIVRHTFGYHKEEIKMSIRKIARFTGLNVNSVMEGATRAEAHGLIEREIEGNQTTVWQAIVRVLPTKTPRLSTSDASVLPTKTQVGVKERKKESNIGLSIENAIFADQPVTEEIIKRAQLKDVAPKQFERALGFSKPLPWWSNKDWSAFAEWVCTQYEHNRMSFGEYNIWRNTPYTKGGMSNNRIRGFLKEFYDSWDMFMMNQPEPEKPREFPPLPDYSKAVPNPGRKPLIPRGIR